MSRNGFKAQANPPGLDFKTCFEVLKPPQVLSSFVRLVVKGIISLRSSLLSIEMACAWKGGRRSGKTHDNGSGHWKQKH